jgi:hypothetical protein
MHEIKTSQTYEVMFAIGSREGYHGPSFTKEQLMDAIGEFQKTCPVSQPVKVTDKVTFVMKDYREDGWDISAICYPNHPPDRPPNQPGQVKEFMTALAEHLLYHFKQNRITVRVFPSWIPSDKFPGFPETFMFEVKDAQKTHTK